MGRQGSSAFSVFLVDGVSLLAAKLQGVTHKVESITEPSHGLGDASEAHSPVGMMRATLTQDGAFFDSGAGGMHETLKAASPVIRQVVFATGGARFTGGVGAFVTAYEVLVATGKLTKANAGYTVSGDVDVDGVILHAHAQQTVDGVTASVDNGASSANGGVGYLSVSEMAGLTGCVFKIQHSVDNSAWVDLVTFANVTGAPVSVDPNAAQRISVVGTVNQYLRVDRNVAGVGTITPFVGFARN